MTRVMGETAKGLHLSAFVRMLESSLGLAEARALCCEANMPQVLRSFGDYPVHFFVHLQELAAARLCAGRCLEDAMLEFGARDFSTFSSSALGRVTLAFVTHDLPRLARQIPAFYSSLNKYGEVAVAELFPKGFTIAFRGYRSYPHYHLGLLREAWHRLRLPGTVDVRILRFERRGPGDVVADFDILFRY